MLNIKWSFSVGRYIQGLTVTFSILKTSLLKKKSKNALLQPKYKIKW